MAVKRQSAKETGNDKAKQSSLPQQIYRTQENKVIGGVCGGIGEYFGVDPTLVRVVFVFLAIFGGSGIVLYLVLWAIMPSKSHIGKPRGDAIKANVEEMKERVKGTAQSFNTQAGSSNRSFWAILLVVIGVLFLINNYGVLNINIGKLWPIFLILLGLLILRRR